MNERGLEEEERKAAMSDEDEIEHTLGPNVRSRAHTHTTHTTLHTHTHTTHHTAHTHTHLLKNASLPNVSSNVCTY